MKRSRDRLDVLQRFADWLRERAHMRHSNGAVRLRAALIQDCERQGRTRCELASNDNGNTGLLG